MTTTQPALVVELIERLRKLDEAATPGPWAYRPEEYDDWGTVRGPKLPTEHFPEGLAACLARFRDHRFLDEAALSEHRTARTDPWEANARLVVALRNEALPTLAAQAAEIERLRGLLADEREENLWNAYNTGHEAGDGRWTHMSMSDGEWLVRECGLDPKIGHYDAATIKAAIPIAARQALGGPNV
jgi:hypothetical protein